MTISHHPADDLLLAYGSGSSNEAVSLLIATHLALCPQCRRVVESAEAAGGSLMLALEPAALGTGALDSVLSRLNDVTVQRKKPSVSTRSNIPQPLRSYLTQWNGEIPWRRIVGGLSCRTLMRKGRTRAMLIKALPGSNVRKHTHRGEELTLVLAGGYTDSTGHYLRGDVQTASPEIDHSLIADEGEPCITLAVTDAPLAFHSLPVALIGKLFGF